jgi:hypothetical protein
LQPLSQTRSGALWDGETRGPEDLNRDGIVNVLDIVIATSNFGACD